MVRDYNIHHELVNFGSFRDLNSTLSIENKMKLVSVKEFKELNKNSKDITDWIVCQTENVEIKSLDDGNLEFIMYRYNGMQFHAVTNGKAWFIRPDGSHKSFSTSKCAGRVVTQSLSCVSSVISIERFIAICCSYILDEMPSTFKDLSLEANVIDLSGNAITAHKIGIKPWNFFPHNIEWTTHDRNAKHNIVMRSIIRKLRLIGFVPEFSANAIDEISDYASMHSANDVVVKYNINSEFRDTSEIDF
jgi:hypothetical protein